MLQRKVHVIQLCYDVQHFDTLCDDFGTHAVPRQHCNTVLHESSSPLHFSSSLFRRQPPRAIPMLTRRVLFRKITAFEIHSAWRGGPPREHCFELLALGEFRYGFLPLLLPIERNTLLVYGTHVD